MLYLSTKETERKVLERQKCDYDGIRTFNPPFFNRIYPPELQLNKANTSDTEAPFLDLHLSISNGFSDFYLTSLQLVLCRVAAVKRLPVHQP